MESKPKLKRLPSTKVVNRGRWSPKEDALLRELVTTWLDEDERDWEKVADYFPNRSSFQCAARWNKVLSPEILKCKWTKEEDEKLTELVNKYGSVKWTLIAKHLKGRIGKQCRERWHNQLNPNINKNPWTEEEDQIICGFVIEHGSKWSQAASLLPGRTDNSIKNRWNSTLKRTYFNLGKKTNKGRKPKGKVNIDNSNSSTANASTSINTTATDTSSIISVTFPSNDLNPFQQEIKEPVKKKKNLKRKATQQQTYTTSTSCTSLVNPGENNQELSIFPQDWMSYTASGSASSISSNNNDNLIVNIKHESLGRTYLNVGYSPRSIMRIGGEDHVQKISSPEGNWNLCAVVERRKNPIVPPRIEMRKSLVQTPSRIQISQLKQPKKLNLPLPSTSTSTSTFTPILSSESPIKMEIESDCDTRNSENTDPWLKDNTPKKYTLLTCSDSLSPSQFACYFDNGGVQKTPDYNKRNNSLILETPNRHPTISLVSPMKTPSPLKRAFEEVRTSQSFISSPFSEEDLQEVIIEDRVIKGPNFLSPHHSGLVYLNSPTSKRNSPSSRKSMVGYKRKIVFDHDSERKEKRECSSSSSSNWKKENSSSVSNRFGNIDHSDYKPIYNFAYEGSNSSSPPKQVTKELSSFSEHRKGMKKTSTVANNHLSFKNRIASFESLHKVESFDDDVKNAYDS